MIKVVFIEKILTLFKANVIEEYDIIDFNFSTGGIK
jgi:hypothetical protein